MNIGAHFIAVQPKTLCEEAQPQTFKNSYLIYVLYYASPEQKQDSIP